MLFAGFCQLDIDFFSIVAVMLELNSVEITIFGLWDGFTHYSQAVFMISSFLTCLKVTQEFLRGEEEVSVQI